MKYGIITECNFSYIKHIFTPKKKVFRIILHERPTNSCKGLFKRLEILAVPCEYILLLINCILSVKKNFREIQPYILFVEEISTILIKCCQNSTH
jgi:hypothetical protein